MSQQPQITLQQAYDRECVLIAEAYSTIRSARQQLKRALERRTGLTGQIAQANAQAELNAKEDPKNDE